MRLLIEDMPKAELHMHLEGSLEPDQLFAFARRNRIDLPYATQDDLRAAYRFADLQAFLDIYYLGLRVLRTERDFYDMTAAYLARAHQDNVVHAELFISPQAHTSRGVAIETVLDGTLAALDDAAKRLGMTGGLILVVQRHLPEADALAMLRSALPYRDRVLGIGLGGAEKGNPPEKFARVFAAARDWGWRCVAHAGEEGPASFVAAALDVLKVDRIDHGVRCEEDPALVTRLAERQIPLTVCPLSNVALRVFPSLAQHNLRRLLTAGLCVTVNSDDPSYFGGYVNENYVASAAALSLSDGELFTLARNSFVAAFMDEPRRAHNLQRLEQFRPG